MKTGQESGKYYGGKGWDRLRYFVGEVRYEKRMSLRELSERARVSKSYLQRIEAGEAAPAS